MYDIIVSRQLFDDDIYAHIIKNIPERICREEIIGDKLNFKILIFSDDVGDTKRDIEYTIKNMKYSCNIHNENDKRISYSLLTKDNEDVIDLEVHPLKDLNYIRGNWCNLMIIDVAENNKHKLFSRELEVAINTICKPLYSQIAYSIIMYE